MTLQDTPRQKFWNVICFMDWIFPQISPCAIPTDGPSHYSIKSRLNVFPLVHSASVCSF